jgi:CheY-like chemotaxis protein
MSNVDFVVEELGRARGKVLDDELHEDLTKALKSSQSGAERVRIIVRDLKMFARVDQASTTEIALNKVLDSAVGMIRNEVRHHATIEKDYGSPPMIVGNEARLLQVFLNLIQNAAQAIPPGHADKNTIRLVTGMLETGHAYAEVHDTGTGIAKENVTRIFDAFFTTKPAGVGTGLGLSICHKLVTQMGGSIDVASDVGIGSVFRVTLPSATSADLTSLARSPLAPISVRKSVLVVDDEPEVGAAIDRLLGVDHEVMTVTRGSAALAVLAERSFDVILCDLMMPEMTGVELYRRLAAESPALAGRVVFMTGGTFGSDVQAFLQSVPNACIDKPFGVTELRRAVGGI